MNKRPAGVVISAVLLFVGALFLAGFAALMAVGGILAQHTSVPQAGGGTAPMASAVVVIVWAESAFLLLAAAWGVVTGVGLLRLRNWARISTIVIGVLQALIAGGTALVMLVLVFMPMPASQNLTADQATHFATIMKGFFGASAAISAVIAAVGVWWVIYFARGAAVRYFTPPVSRTAGESFTLDGIAKLPDVSATSRRPVAIMVLAILFWFGSVGCLLGQAFPVPALLFGSVYGGWQKAAIYLALAALQFATGLGLWRLQRWSTWLAIGSAVFGLVHVATMTLRPASYFQYQQMVRNQFMLTTPDPVSPAFHTAAMMMALAFCLVWCGAIVWVVRHYRHAFDAGSEGRAI